MGDNISRRAALGYLAGAASGVGLAALVGSSRDDGPPKAVENRTPIPPSNETPGQSENSTADGARLGDPRAHVIPEGSHRGENNFTYFVDRASLGLDRSQPEEVYSRVYLKFRSDWTQPTDDDTCKLFWAGCNLSAGPAGQGGSPPTGDDGWSVRIFSRGPVADGGVSLGAYVYHLDQSGDFGSLWQWPDSAPIGRWFRLDSYVRLNSVTDGSADRDGVLRMWLDGDRQLERTDLRWRTTERLGFDRLGPGTYWGGTVVSPARNVVFYDGVQYAVGAEGLRE